MNLDLNLGPVIHPPQNDQSHDMNFEDLLRGTTINHRLRPVGAAASASGAASSVAADDTYENGDEGNFFDCNICLDLANDPVVTCCGHLFCWPCIYRWLVVHSDAKQCPICKGEVTVKTVTPIYSRVNHTLRRKAPNPNLSFKIPSRPPANRIESWRHSFQRDALDLPIIEMVRRLDNNRFHLFRDPLSSNPQEISSTLLLNRIFTSRGIRSGHDSVPATLPDVTVDLPDDHTPDLASAESFVDSYFRDHPDERNQEELPLIDRHSMSSVTDIMQSETTGLRRRREPSMSTVLDIDSGDSRSRRRRLP